MSTKSSEFVSRSIEAVRENREQVLTSAQGLLNSSRDVVHENRDQVVVSSKSILNWSKDAYEEVVDRSSEQTKNMREIFMLTGTNLNSLVYTVLTFVFVLVMILVLMVTNKNGLPKELCIAAPFCFLGKSIEHIQNILKALEIGDVVNVNKVFEF